MNTRLTPQHRSLNTAYNFICFGIKKTNGCLFSCSHNIFDDLILNSLVNFLFITFFCKIYILFLFLYIIIYVQIDGDFMNKYEICGGEGPHEIILFRNYEKLKVQ